jgi:trimeric autotransporter adhesin
MFSGRKLPITLAFAVLLGLAFGASCKGFFVDPQLTAIGVSPATQTITDGTTNNTQQFTAVGTFDDGSHHSTSVTWGVTPPDGSIATITTGGLATGTGVGTATITATSTIIPTISGTASLTVVSANITSITVTPGSTSTAQGQTFNLKAVDQGAHDISTSVNWTFTLEGTTQQETGITKDGAGASGGEDFTITTLSPAPPSFPATLDAVATVTIVGTTVTSNTVKVSVAQQ